MHSNRPAGLSPQRPALQQPIYGRGPRGDCHTECLVEHPTQAERGAPSPGLPWQQLGETWAPGKATRPAHLCWGRGEALESMSQAPLVAATLADMDPCRAGGVWAGLVVRKGRKQASRGERSQIPPAGRRQRLLPSVSSEGRSTLSSLSSTAGSWEGMTESCGGRDGALQSDGQGHRTASGDAARL